MNQVIKLITAVIVICLVGAIGWMALRNNGAAEAATREVTDSTGAKITIPVHPKRVVFLNASNLDMYYAAGGTAVGKPTSTSITPDLQEKTKDVPEVGIIHNPNMETILSLRPDLVIGVNVPFHTGIRETLANAGIPLYINNLNTYDDVLNTVREKNRQGCRPAAEKSGDRHAGQNQP